MRQGRGTIFERRRSSEDRSLLSLNRVTPSIVPSVPFARPLSRAQVSEAHFSRGRTVDSNRWPRRETFFFRDFFDVFPSSPTNSISAAQLGSAYFVSKALFMTLVSARQRHFVERFTLFQKQHSQTSLTHMYAIFTLR